MRLIFYLLGGQFISGLGSALTRFSMGVWLYQETGSATLFSLIAVSLVLPNIIAGPFVGAIVDRYDRRLVMIGSDLGAGLTTVAAVLILSHGDLLVWHIVVLVFLSSLFESFQGPAWLASVTLIAPKEHWGRVSGLSQTSTAVAFILGPLLAGFLLEVVSLRTIFLMDMISFCFAIFTLLTCRFPQLERGEQKTQKTTMLQEFKEGWRYVRNFPGLPAMLGFFAGINFASSFAQILLTPMVLELSTASKLGLIMAGAGTGMLLGSLVMASFGRSENNVVYLLLGTAFTGLAYIVQGSQPTWWLVMVGAAMSAFCLPIINGNSQVIWQKKVPPELQGRVFSLRRMVAWGANPISYLLAGVLAERVFTPAMVEGGWLAGFFGPIIGVGPSRGAGLMFIIQGGFLIVLVLLSWHYQPLRKLDDP